MEKKFYWIITILGLIIFILTGYIIYDKVILYQNNDNNEVNENPNDNMTNDHNEINENQNDNITSELQRIFNSLPTNSDASVVLDKTTFDLEKTSFDLEGTSIDFKTNFKDIKVNKYGFDLTLNCTKFEYDYRHIYTNGEESVCTTYEILINGQNNEILVDYEYGLVIVITNDYFIVYDNAFTGKIKIIDKEGNKIFSDTVAITFGMQDDNGTYLNVNGYTPTVKDNKLYYVNIIKEESITSLFSIKTFDFQTKQSETLTNFPGAIGFST